MAVVPKLREGHVFPFRLEPYVWPHSSYNCEIKLLMML